MEIFLNDYSNLMDCNTSIKFCTKVKALITAINSRTPIGALKPGSLPIVEGKRYYTYTIYISIVYILVHILYLIKNELIKNKDHLSIVNINNIKRD